ncbi:MAG TPA: alpha/beta hydrolase [Steroidobacteraceae bacterium]
MKTLVKFTQTAALALLLAATLPAFSAAPKTGYAKANGIDYYYEIAGQGEPLLLLHGGLGSIEMFRPLLPALTARRTVIALDLQGHGRTLLGARALDLRALGNDMAVVLDELGYAQVDVLGYSFGGGVGFQLAAQHPQKVRRLALVSAGFSDEGFYPGIREQQKQLGAASAEFMKDTPMYQGYAAVAPKVDDFPRLLQAIGDLMRKPYDFAEDAKKLGMPTMLVFGDSDMYRPEHVVEFYQLLGGGLQDGGWQRENVSRNRLAIIPGATHYDIFFSPQLLPTVLPFLDGESGAKTWAEQVEATKK